MYEDFKSGLAETCEFNVVSSLEGLQEILGRGDVKTVFLSLEIGMQKWQGIQDSIKLQMPDLKWVFFSEGPKESAELTAHQNSAQPADGYLSGPLTVEMIQDYFEDIILVEQTLSSINTADEAADLDLDFSAGSGSHEDLGADIQKKFDEVIEEPASDDELSFQLNLKEPSAEDIADDDLLNIDLESEKSQEDMTLIKPIDMSAIEENNDVLDIGLDDDNLLGLDDDKDSGLSLDAEDSDEQVMDGGTSSINNNSFNIEDGATLTETSLDYDESLGGGIGVIENKSSTDLSSNELSMLHMPENLGFGDTTDESLTSINVLRENQSVPNQKMPTHPFVPEAKQEMEYWSQRDSEALSETLAEIKSDRARLLNEIQMLKDENIKLRRQDITYRTEIEDLKVELELMKNRAISQNQDLKFQLQLLEDKKSLLEQKSKDYQIQYQQLSEKHKINHNQVKEREIKLEGQLDLLKADSKAQIENRENIIIELKRKIDNLEFNIENISIKEGESKQHRLQAEQKLNKVISSLRFCIDILETEENNADKLKVLNTLKNIG